MSRSSRTTRRGHRKADSRTTILLLFFVVASFALVMGFRIQALSSAYRHYEVQYQAAQKTLEEEQIRLKELQDQQQRTQTEEDIEKAAREQLGLIRPGEILLKPNQ